MYLLAVRTVADVLEPAVRNSVSSTDNNTLTASPAAPLPAALAGVVGPVPAGVTLPMPPSFETVEAERQYRKEQLAAGFRLFGRFGFSEGWRATSPCATRRTRSGSG